MVALGDQPGITADVVAELVRSFHATGRGIVVPTHQDKRGHPLLFRDASTATRFSRIMKVADCVDYSTRTRKKSSKWRSPSSGVLEDIDLPEDYRRAISRLPP